MNCPNCGKQLVPDAVFCNQCGTKLEKTVEKQEVFEPVPEVQSAPVYENPNTGYRAPQRPEAPVKEDKSTLGDKFKELVRGPLVMVLVACLILTALLSIASVMMVGGGEAPISIYVGVIIGLIPSILIIAGILTVRSKCSPFSGSVSGFGMIKVSPVIGIVLICLAAFVILIAAVMVAVGADAFSDQLKELFMGMGSSDIEDIEDLATGIVAIVTVVCMIILALAALYYAKIIESLNVARDAISGIRPRKNVSIYVAVINILSAVLTAISTLGIIASLSSVGVMPALGVIYILSGVAGAVGCIVASVIIFKARGLIYNDKMTNPGAYSYMNNSYVRPNPYGNPGPYNNPNPYNNPSPYNNQNPYNNNGYQNNYPQR